MPLIDFILNLTGLMLWLNWLSLHFDPLAKTSATSLVGTLRKADASGPKRWRSLAAVVGLLLVRAFAYWQIGPALNWTPKLDLGVINLYFRNEYVHFYYFERVLLYSFLSFTFTLAAFYLSLLLLSAVNRNVPDTDILQKLVRVYFQWLERWPTWLKLLTPLLGGALFWIAMHPMFTLLGIVPTSKSSAQFIEQSLVIGAGTYLSWKYLIVGVLLLHLLNSYVYLGDHPFWGFVNVTAKNLLYPLRWLPLRIGKVDLLPVIALALVILIVNFASLADFLSHPRGSFRPWLYQHLPF
jgi:uncharacterized protein YggT (Ycf19 family)